MSSEIQVDRDGDTAVITINRPHRRNACDFAAWTDLKGAFEQLGAEPAVKLLVLTGAGGHFCAGDDIVAFAPVRDDPVQADVWRARIQECYAAVQATPKPVIAALQGACVGGGCSLAMCCDFRVADHSVRVGVPVARLGLVYPTIQMQRLAWLIGASNARRWIYAAGIYDSAECERVGFIDAVTDGNVITAALEFGQEMALAAPLSIAGAKAQLNAVLAGQVEQRRSELDAMVRRADESEDFREAMRAFRDKRTPQFLGR
jgi:enoyl-CoA hydratase/carnithine racemase